MHHILPAETPDHFAAAHELFVEYADQLAHDLCFQNFAHELENLAELHTPPNGFLLLATSGEKWVGCVAVRHFADRICQMKRLYVRPTHRRGGLGRELAKQIIQRARQMGFECMRLDTLASMLPARTLYESLGFREVPPYYHNPIENVVFYELELTGV